MTETGKRRQTPSHEAVDERFFALEEVGAYNFLPVVAIEDELVFEKIYIGSLVSDIFSFIYIRRGAENGPSIP